MAVSLVGRFREICTICTCSWPATRGTEAIRGLRPVPCYRGGGFVLLLSLHIFPTTVIQVGTPASPFETNSLWEALSVVSEKYRSGHSPQPCCLLGTVTRRGVPDTEFFTYLRAAHLKPIDNTSNNSHQKPPKRKDTSKKPVANRPLRSVHKSLGSPSPKLIDAHEVRSRT